MALFHRLLFRETPAIDLRLCHLDEETEALLDQIAEREQRDRNELISELLAYAVRKRNADYELMNRWNKLTRREQEVVAYACMEWSNKQIGYQLGITSETVKAHLQNATRKFDLQSKAQLIKLLSDWDFSDWCDRPPE